MSKNPLSDISNRSSLQDLLTLPIKNDLSHIPRTSRKRKYNNENENPCGELSKMNTRLRTGAKKCRTNFMHLSKPEPRLLSPDSNRKEKSLIILCEKFFQMFPLDLPPDKAPPVIDLGELTVFLGSERRRLYDIVNILESLNMASKIEKNRYSWKGSAELLDTLARLKRLALQLQVDSNTGDSTHIYPLQNDVGCPNSRKDRSLGILCQKFLMMFLVSPPPHKVTLEAALYFLRDPWRSVGEESKTKNRRVYDISNVLGVLKLVEKTTENHKLFRYVGPHVEPTPEEEVFGENRMRQSLLSPKTPTTQLSQMSLTSPRVMSPEVQMPRTTPSVAVSPIPRKDSKRDDFLSLCEFASKEFEKLHQNEKAKEKKIVSHVQEKPKTFLMTSPRDIEDRKKYEDQRSMPAPSRTKIHRPTPLRLVPVTAGNSRIALTFRNVNDPPSPRVEPGAFFASKFPIFKVAEQKPPHSPIPLDQSPSYTPPVTPTGMISPSPRSLGHFRRIGLSTPIARKSEDSQMSPLSNIRFLFSPLFSDKK